MVEMAHIADDKHCNNLIDNIMVPNFKISINIYAYFKILLLIAGLQFVVNYLIFPPTIPAG
jgi:hypothetical protein